MRSTSFVRASAVCALLSLLPACGARVSTFSGDAATDPDAAQVDATPQGDASVPDDRLTPVVDVPRITDVPLTVDVPATRDVQRVDVTAPPDVGMPVPCPSSLDGDGLACDAPFTGCGSAGGACSISCTCGSDRRWHCTGSGPGCPDAGVVDVPEPDVDLPDAFRPDAPPPDVTLPDGGVCSLRGAWSVAVEGESLFFDFGDGMWGAGIDPSSAVTAPVVGGSYSYAGFRLTLREDRPGTMSGCGPTAEGVYDVYWDAACAGFNLATVRDECHQRETTLSRIHFAR